MQDVEDVLIWFDGTQNGFSFFVAIDTKLNVVAAEMAVVITAFSFKKLDAVNKILSRKIPEKKKL